jgi:shikimate dehydrogenase
MSNVIVQAKELSYRPWCCVTVVGTGYESNILSGPLSRTADGLHDRGEESILSPDSGHRLGLIGHPIGHSRSPAMQQAALDALGIHATYEPWDTTPDQLTERVASLRLPGILGANVTIPHKLAVMPLLDEVVSEARATGAVNTIVRQETADGVRLFGYNTDVDGLARALDEAGAPGGVARILVLGAGGAARAALAVARRRNAPVRVAARNVAKPRAALPGIEAVDLGTREKLEAALHMTDLLINATPAGMAATDETPLAPELLTALPGGAFVFDMVYAPPETALVRAARACGLRASGGLAMLLYQGAAAFTLWTGQEAPIAVMRAALGIEREQ